MTKTAPVDLWNKKQKKSTVYFTIERARLGRRDTLQNRNEKTISETFRFSQLLFCFSARRTSHPYRPRAYLDLHSGSTAYRVNGPTHVPLPLCLSVLIYETGPPKSRQWDVEGIETVSADRALIMALCCNRKRKTHTLEWIHRLCDRTEACSQKDPGRALKCVKHHDSRDHSRCFTRGSLVSCHSPVSLWVLTLHSRGLREINGLIYSVGAQRLDLWGSKRFNGCRERAPSWGHRNHCHVLDPLTRQCLEVWRLFPQVIRTSKVPWKASLGPYKLNSVSLNCKTLGSHFTQRSHTS